MLIKLTSKFWIQFRIITMYQFIEDNFLHSNFYCRPIWFYNFFCWFIYFDISLKSGLAWTWSPISHHLFSIHPKERTLKEEFTLALEDLIWWVYRNLSELNFVTPLKIIIKILLFQLVCYVHSKAMSIWKCFRLPSMLDCGFSWLCLVVPLSMHSWLVGTNCWSSSESMMLEVEER